MTPQFNYKCTSCDEISSADGWNDRTFEQVILDDKLDDEAIDNLIMVSIDEAKWDGYTWFVCPYCGETAWDDSKNIVKIPAEAQSNKAAKHLLEKRY